MKFEKDARLVMALIGVLMALIVMIQMIFLIQMIHLSATGVAKFEE